MMILMLIGLFTSRIILKELGVEDYGIQTIVGGVVTMFFMITGSLTNAISRFITFELGKGDAEKLKVIFSSAIIIQLFFSVIIILIGETVGLWFVNEKLVIPNNRMVAANFCYQMSLLTFVIGLVSIPYNSLIIAHEKMTAFAYISIFEAIGTLFIAFLISLSVIDRLILFSFLTTIITIFVRFLYIWYCKKHFVEAVFSCKFDRTVISPMFSFAGWNMLGASSFVLRNQGVDILLNFFFGVTINAAKGICNQVESKVSSFVTNFLTAMNPQLTMSIAKGDYLRNHELVFQGSRFSFFLLSFFSVPFLIETEQILSLWLGNVPAFTVAFVQWTFIYLQMDSLSQLLITSIFAYGKIRNYQIIVGGLKLLVLPIAWLFLFYGGSPVTGIIVNIIVEIFCLALRLYYNFKFTKLPALKYVYDVVIHCWVIYFVILLISYGIMHYSRINYIVIIILSLIITTVVIWIMGLKKSERNLIMSKVCTIVRKI